MSPARNDTESKATARSVRLYERLLCLYPATHRRDYGAAMAQLFRDQCRDAWRARGGWGLVWLWLRVLPDLVRTSVTEHLSALHERKTMLERVGTLLRPRSAPLLVFLAVFVPVFFLTVGTDVLVTFLMPELYSSTARVKLPQSTMVVAPQPPSPTPTEWHDPYSIQSQFEVIESPAVLGKVIEELDLNNAWGKKYAKGEPLAFANTLLLLKSRLDLRPIRGTTLIEIRVLSESPDEAASIANAVADSYRESRSEGPRPETVDRAVPGLRPVQPNKPLNIVLGIAGGALLGLFAGAGMAGIAARASRRSRELAPPPAVGH